MEYKKREFCKAMKCAGLEFTFLCPQNCKYSAWEFHDWLQKNNFKIIKNLDEKKQAYLDSISDYEVQAMEEEKEREQAEHEAEMEGSEYE